MNLITVIRCNLSIAQFSLWTNLEFGIYFNLIEFDRLSRTYRNIMLRLKQICDIAAMFYVLIHMQVTITCKKAPCFPVFHTIYFCVVRLKKVTLIVPPFVSSILHMYMPSCILFWGNIPNSSCHIRTCAINT